jgi:hypothetical protein
MDVGRAAVSQNYVSLRAHRVRERRQRDMLQRRLERVLRQPQQLQQATPEWQPRITRLIHD